MWEYALRIPMRVTKGDLNMQSDINDYNWNIVHRDVKQQN